MARKKKLSGAAGRKKAVPRPKATRSGTRAADPAKLAREAMPSLCRTLIERGNEGDLAAIRLVWQMATTDTAKKGSAAKDTKAQKKRDDLFARETVKSILNGLEGNSGLME